MNKVLIFSIFVFSHSVAEFFDEVHDKLDSNDLTAYGKLDFTRGINANVYRRILGVKEKIKHPKSPETPPPSQIHQEQIQECKKQFVAFQQGLQPQRPYAIPTSVISGGKRSKNASLIKVKVPKLPEAASNSGASSEGGEELEDNRNGAEEILDDDEEEELTQHRFSVPSSNRNVTVFADGGHSPTSTFDDDAGDDEDDEEFVEGHEDHGGEFRVKLQVTLFIIHQHSVSRKKVHHRKG